jgi:hypothetical protein
LDLSSSIPTGSPIWRSRRCHGTAVSEPFTGSKMKFGTVVLYADRKEKMKSVRRKSGRRSHQRHHQDPALRRQERLLRHGARREGHQRRRTGRLLACQEGTGGRGVQDGDAESGA